VDDGQRVGPAVRGRDISKVRVGVWPLGQRDFVSLHPRSAIAHGTQADAVTDDAEASRTEPAAQRWADCRAALHDANGQREVDRPVPAVQLLAAAQDCSATYNAAALVGHDGVVVRSGLSDVPTARSMM
jgi:hypothetical protein